MPDARFPCSSLLEEESLAEASFKSEETRSGVPTAYINGKALHSRFDPIKEAIRTAQNAPNAAILVLGGLGLGYVAEALLKENETLILIIAEADAGLPGQAAKTRDITALINNPRVSLFAGGDPADITELLKGGAAGSILEYMEWKPSASAHPKWYARLKEIVKETKRRRAINARTLERFGPLWVRNLAKNIPVMLNAVSINQWENFFEGIPALIIAGGPSLENILPELKDLKERFLVIAVDTASSAVLRQGIKPDIIAAVDPQYWNIRHLDMCGRNTNETKDIIVLAEAATHPAVFNRLPGKSLITRTKFPLGTILEDAAGIKGMLQAGGSVATSAWDLARHLGCSPMFAAGLDLGFPGGKTHFSGSLSRERPLMYSKRTAPAEGVFFHALHDAGCRKVPSAGGGGILSDARMDVYASWFSESAQKIPERSPALVGSGGRAIKGMGTVDIEELKRFPECRSRIDFKLKEIKESKPEKYARQNIQGVLSAIIKALHKLEKSSLEGLETAIDAHKSLNEGYISQESINRMNRIDNEILNGQGRELVSFLIQPIILDIESAGNGKNKHPLEASRELYEEIAKSASYHIKYLERAEKKLLGKA